MATPVISGITRTNLGPLTTDTFTYKCTEVIQRCSTCDVGWAAQTCIRGVVSDNTDCWPPRAANVPPTGGPLLEWGVYSPGIVCPGGYTSAASGIYGGPSDFHFQYPMSVGESAIGCCPQGGFSPIHDPNGYQTCVQFLPTTSFLVGSCGLDGAAYTPFSLGGMLDSKQYTSFSVSAPLIQLVHQASDLPTSTTTTSEPAVTELGSENNNSSSSDSSVQPTPPANHQSPTPTPTPTPTPIPTQNTISTLSTGATAGIAIGAVLGVLFIGMGAFCLWRGKHRRPASESPPPPPPPPPPPHRDGDGDGDGDATIVTTVAAESNQPFPVEQMPRPKLDQQHARRSQQALGVGGQHYEYQYHYYPVELASPGEMAELGPNYRR
ncbi:hypothetical protein GGR50DRAFT_570486 [Xylaria sp. CBS 124048]|nr:hypothetical protein GGR50DRAFT_570486 [Xylaria sp. CBS 124048]